MDILIGIVIAIFIITAAYVGFYASQAPVPEGEAHSVPLEPHTSSYEISQISKAKADQIHII